MDAIILWDSGGVSRKQCEYLAVNVKLHSDFYRCDYHWIINDRYLDLETKHGPIDFPFDYVAEIIPIKS